MGRYRLYLLIIVALAMTGYGYLVPNKAEAAATTSVSQVILPPDCYDYVSNVSGTIDYIATFDCQIRRPDGTGLDGTRMEQGTVSVL